MFRRFASLYLFSAILVLVSGLTACRSEAAGPGPVRVLVLSGQNNHDWRTTTPQIVAILRGSGRFDVRVTEETGQAHGRRLRLL